MMDNKPDENKNEATLGDLKDRWRLKELQKANQEFKEARLAALNLMEDAILSEQALRQSEARYRFLFDNIDQGVQICELVRNKAQAVTDLQPIHVNPAWIHITGANQEPVKNQKVEKLPARDQPWFRYCEQVKENGSPARFETRMNEDRWLDVFVTQMEGDRFMILLTDITERKRHDVNQSFLAYCSVALLKAGSLKEIVDAIGENARTYLGVNACTFLKVEEDQDTLQLVAGWEEVSQPLPAGILQLSALVSQSNLVQLSQAIPLILQQEDTEPTIPKEPALGLMRTALYVPVVRDQQIRYMLCVYHTSPYHWFNDQVSLLSELAGRAWNKLAHLEAEEKLKASEENYKAIVNQSVSGIFKLSLDGQILFTNNYFARMLGYTAEELMQFTVKDIVHPDDLDKTFAGFNGMVESGQPFEVDKRLKRKDRSVIWVTNYAAPLFDSLKQPIGAIVVSVDISRQKAVEQQKDEFISIASHELKTPLTSVKAYGQLVQQTSKEGNAEELADMIGRMNLHIDRLVNLVGTILDTTKLERQEYSLNLEKMDINEMISEKVKENQLAAPHFRFVFNPCEMAWIYGDKTSLGQVLNNLISNAVKYSPQGSTITIDCDQSENNIKVCVTDEGIGISEKDQEKIFDKYYRSAGLLESGRSGIGLGLYLCGEIIRRHNGAIGVSSILGSGTTFYFAIPSINLNGV
ncbi:ATP-binding protein [Niabella sp. CJ426]|uniref:ATP-binding protein n=1 Tax=Niabella sp. CJ426 TaxID=3393740 RepID=UPI003D07754F